MKGMLALAFAGLLGCDKSPSRVTPPPAMAQPPALSTANTQATPAAPPPNAPAGAPSIPPADATTGSVDAATGLLAYAASCRSRSKRRVMPAQWEAALKDNNTVTRVFTSPTEVQLGDGTRTVDALVVPRSGPFADQVLARSGESLYSPYVECDAALLR